jgi:hypothetical protein
MIAILRDTGFEILEFTVPDPYDAQMQLYAVRQSA